MYVHQLAVNEEAWDLLQGTMAHVLSNYAQVCCNGNEVLAQLELKRQLRDRLVYERCEATTLPGTLGLTAQDHQAAIAEVIARGSHRASIHCKVQYGIADAMGKSRGKLEGWHWIMAVPIALVAHRIDLT